MIKLRKWLKTGLFRSAKGTAPKKQSELIEAETAIIKVIYETKGLWDIPVQQGEMSFEEIQLPNVGQHLEPGEPAVPQEGLYVAIPEGATVIGIKVVSEKKKTFNLDQPVKPAPQPTTDKTALPELLPKQEIYDKEDEAFPGVLFKDLGMKEVGDVQVLHLMMYPVQYRPPSTIDLYTKIELEITYELGAAKEIPMRGGRKRVPAGAEEEILNFENI